MAFRVLSCLKVHLELFLDEGINGGGSALKVRIELV